MRRYCLVATAFVVRDGKTLLHEHRKLKMWLPPGGHVEDGETPEQAVVREVREETGLEIEFVVPKRSPDPDDGSVEYQHPPQMVQVERIPNHNHHLDHIYYVRAKPGPVRTLEGDAAAWRWLGPEELAAPHITDEVRTSALEAIRLVERGLISGRESA